MKKLFVLACAALMTAAFVLPAAAVEHQFGGYWRTRAYTLENYGDTLTADDDLTQVDTRTRLYYTAVINENLKFVNKFEFNAVWGGPDANPNLWNSSFGDIGADGNNVVVKNSYVDFNYGPMNFKVGTQPVVSSRGFLFDDDCSGVTAAYKADNMGVEFIWIKEYEGHTSANPLVDNTDDIDQYIARASFGLGDVTVVPFLHYVHQSNTSVTDVDTKNHFLGVDVDAKLGMASVWFTGIYEFGEINDVDIDSFFLALGASADMGQFGIHGQAFYAHGDDINNNGNDDSFAPPLGAFYSWAEILEGGMFDVATPAGSPGSVLSNVWALNIGADFKPMDKLTLGADLWYAKRVEDRADRDGGLDDDLGTEVDLKATYELIDNLQLDVVAAYLWGGDCILTDQEDIYKLGTQLSLSF